MLSWAGPAALCGQPLMLVVCGWSIPTWHHCGCRVGAEEREVEQEWQTFLSLMHGHGERDRCSVRQGDFASLLFKHSLNSQVSHILVQVGSYLQLLALIS